MAEKIGDAFVEIDARTSSFRRKLASAGDRFAAFAARLGALAGRMSLIVGAALAAIGIKALKAFSEQELAEKRLADALRSTGDATLKNLNKFKKLAAEIQKTTTFGDEQIIAQIALAKNMGITTDKLEAVTRAAVGLSARIGRDLATTMLLVIKANSGMTAELSRYGIVLDRSLSPQEKFNELLRLGEEAFTLAEGEADTLSGAFTQLKNAIGDSFEVLGGTISRLFRINELLEEGTELAPKLGQTVVSAVETMSIMFINAQAAMERFFTTLKFIISGVPTGRFDEMIANIEKERERRIADLGARLRGGGRIDPGRRPEPDAPPPPAAAAGAPKSPFAFFGAADIQRRFQQAAFEQRRKAIEEKKVKLAEENVRILKEIREALKEPLEGPGVFSKATS